MANFSKQVSAEKVIEAQLMKAARVLEDTLDEKINELDNIDEDGLEAIRRKRLTQMKEDADKCSDWIAAGHGVYSELASEREFFEAGKKSTFGFVCHFYRDSAFRCKIVDKHLSLLAPKHIECRMAKINAEKSPFLTKRLGVVVLPTILLVKGEKICDRIVGFDDLGGHDEFSTAMLEWRLAVGQVIKYSGDISTPPDARPAGHRGFSGSDYRRGAGKTIRGREGDDEDDD